MGITAAEFREMMAAHNASETHKHYSHPEHDLQVSCLRWFAAAYPKYKGLMWATPNGVRLTPMQASMAKAEGLQKGVPDLFLAVARSGKHGLFIEMKNGKAGRLSSAQKEKIDLLKEQGYACVVCRSFEDFKDVITLYMK